jgi:hypothetical protein
MATLLARKVYVPAAQGARSRPRAVRVVASVDWELAHTSGRSVSLKQLWDSHPHKCVLANKGGDVGLPVKKDVNIVVQGTDKDANHLELLVVEDATSGVTLNGKKLMVQKPAAMKPGDLLCIDDLTFRVMRGTFAHA